MQTKLSSVTIIKIYKTYFTDPCMWFGVVYMWRLLVELCAATMIKHTIQACWLERDAFLW